MDTTKKNSSFRFGIRTLLIVLTVACVFLGILVYRAQEQAAAAKDFRDKGCTVWRKNELVSRETFTFDGKTTIGGPNPSRSGIKISLPVIAERQDNSWVKKAIGDAYFDRYTAIDVPVDSTIDFSDICTNLSRMPYVETVFIDIPLLNYEFEARSKKFPSIKFSNTINRPYIQILDELNEWDQDELYYYNNPVAAAEKNRKVSGESSGYIESRLEFLNQMKRSASWSNQYRRYELQDENGK